MIISYLFSDSDIAFYSLMYESALPEVVPDPFGCFSIKKIKRLQQKFYERQQLKGLLDVNGDNVVVTDEVSKSLSPIYYGDIMVGHTDLSLYKPTECDAAFYIMKDRGVTLVQRESTKQYRIIWYPDVKACYPDFLAGFSLKNLGSPPEQAFKLCGDAAEMDIFIKNCRKGIVDKLTDYADRANMEPKKLASIVKDVYHDNKAIIATVDRAQCVKPGGIQAKLLPEKQIMFRFIASPDGNLCTVESFTSGNLMYQIMDFEGS